jgi:hypothetical protein
LTQLSLAQLSTSQLDSARAAALSSEQEKQLRVELHTAMKSQSTTSDRQVAALTELEDVKSVLARVQSEHMLQMQDAKRALKDTEHRLRAVTTLRGTPRSHKGDVSENRRVQQKADEHVLRETERHQKELSRVQKEHGLAMSRAEEVRHDSVG